MLIRARAPHPDRLPPLADALASHPLASGTLGT